LREEIKPSPTFHQLLHDTHGHEAVIDRLDEYLRLRFAFYSDNQSESAADTLFTDTQTRNGVQKITDAIRNGRK
jgi:hypothetical protein